MLRTARTNEEWITELTGSGALQRQAADDLREYLLRAVLVYLKREREVLSQLQPSELMELAEGLVEEALGRIQRELDHFRGDSKFTTWAYRVVISVAIATLRRWYLMPAVQTGEGGSYDFNQHRAGIQPESCCSGNRN